jgi:AcrR family transcriptional regulator
MTENLKPTLRERKHARTRLALMRAATERLEKAPLTEIAVKDVCAAAEVSEATFFNYFSTKHELLDYYLQLWLLELAWGASRSEAWGLVLIGQLYDRVAKQFQQRPGLMAEIIAHQARQREKSALPELSAIERRLAFPDANGIEDFSAVGLDKLWLGALQQAIEAGELPPNTHLPTVMVSLVSIFYGVPLALRQGNPAAITGMYRQQLALLWAGVRATAQSKTTV